MTRSLAGEAVEEPARTYIVDRQHDDPTIHLGRIVRPSPLCILSLFLAQRGAARWLFHCPPLPGAKIFNFAISCVIKIIQVSRVAWSFENYRQRSDSGKEWKLKAIVLCRPRPPPEHWAFCRSARLLALSLSLSLGERLSCSSRADFISLYRLLCYRITAMDPWHCFFHQLKIYSNLAQCIPRLV